MSQTHFMRQNDRLPTIKALAFTEDVLVNLTAFTSFTFKMVGPVTKTGTATGNAQGELEYAWAAGDTAEVGTYAAVFIATDGSGKTQTFPTGTNLEVIVVPAI